MTVPDLATIAMLVVSLCLAHGANARWARLWTEDEITASLRTWFAKLPLLRKPLHRPEGQGWVRWALRRLGRWLERPLRYLAAKFLHVHNWLRKWLDCPWCLGWWTAWPWAAVAWFPIMGLRFWWLYLVAGWSVAHAAGRLNHNHGGS